MVRLVFEGLPEGVRSGWPFILYPGHRLQVREHSGRIEFRAVDL